MFLKAWNVKQGIIACTLEKFVRQIVVRIVILIRSVIPFNISIIVCWMVSNSNSNLIFIVLNS